MMTRSKTKKEVKADVINATKKLNDLHEISATFISVAMKLRNAVWSADHAKRRLAQSEVSDQYVEKATYLGNYDD